MKKITFEEACAKTGFPATLPYPKPTNAWQESQNFLYQLQILSKAYNGDWQMNLLDDDQRKWYPWTVLNASASGFRFRDSYYDDSRADAGSGVRLASKELSYFFGQEHEELISNHILSLEKFYNEKN